MALMGVRPVWATGSQRVDDFEILPLSLLDRPRVDVTLRVSGFFRDAFANPIRLFDAAVQAVAALDEPDDMNPLAAKVRSERQALLESGLDPEVRSEEHKSALQYLMRISYDVCGLKKKKADNNAASCYRR